MQPEVALTPTCDECGDVWLSAAQTAGSCTSTSTTSPSGSARSAPRASSAANSARRSARAPAAPHLESGVRAACDDPGTILGRRDFVVIMRHWRQQGPVRSPDVWTPIGVVDSLELAAAMADLVREDEAGADVSVVSADDLFYELRSQDREHILERLNSRTSNEIQRDLALRRAAAERLAKHERRSGCDRRSGRNRRSDRDWKSPGRDRRLRGDRRSGLDRRRAKTAT